MSYNVGDTVTLDGIECVIVYKADTEQSWGRYICIDRNYDLSYYVTGSNYVNTGKGDDSSVGTWAYEWGGYGVSTGVTSQEIGDGLSNTDKLISMNLKPNTSGWKVVWDLVKDFRLVYGDKWFVPTLQEILQADNYKDSLKNLTLTVIGREYWVSCEFDDTQSVIIRATFWDDSRAEKNTHSTRTRLCRYATDAEINSSIAETIEMSCETPDADIRYTLDGTDPTEGSLLYEAPIEVVSAILKARGFKSGMLASDIAEYEVTAAEKLPTPVVLSAIQSMGYEIEIYVKDFDSLTLDNFHVEWLDIYDGTWVPYGINSLSNNGGGNYTLYTGNEILSGELYLYISSEGYIDSARVKAIQPQLPTPVLTATFERISLLNYFQVEITIDNIDDYPSGIECSAIISNLNKEGNVYAVSEFAHFESLDSAIGFVSLPTSEKPWEPSNGDVLYISVTLRANGYKDASAETNVTASW